jgi:hypothetical protein
MTGKVKGAEDGIRVGEVVEEDRVEEATTKEAEDGTKTGKRTREGARARTKTRPPKSRDRIGHLHMRAVHHHLHLHHICTRYCPSVMQTSGHICFVYLKHSPNSSPLNSLSR